MREQIFLNVFEELHTGIGIEGIWAFLDNNIVIAFVIAETFN